MSYFCDRHKMEYDTPVCPICSELRHSRRQAKRIEAELKAQQKIDAEEAEKARIERETPPCQLGQRCEWATHTGVNITCSRLIAGCVMLEARA